MKTTDTYLALGDSMSIDDYTGVVGGGAVNQYFQSLGDGWGLDDRTFDGCRMNGVSDGGQGDLVTLTIGGNDLLQDRERYLREGLESFATEHEALLTRIRKANPNATIIVGDVYRPAEPLGEMESAALKEANAIIRANTQSIGARLAVIHKAFQGNEPTLLCYGIEPTLEGAKVIASLFRDAHAASHSG